MKILVFVSIILVGGVLAGTVIGMYFKGLQLQLVMSVMVGVLVGLGAVWASD